MSTTTKLIATRLLEAGFVPGIDHELAEGAEFEVSTDVAETLLTAGHARLASAPLSTPAPSKERTVRARVLADCAHGKANDLVDLPTSVAKQAEKEGFVDTDKAAVAYAASLEQNQKDKA